MERKCICTALASLQSTLADIREYLFFLRNCQIKGNLHEKFDPEYVASLKAKYFDRLEYYHYCESEYARIKFS